MVRDAYGQLTLQHISERIFNLLHHHDVVDMTRFMADKFGIGANIVLRCAYCDTKGKDMHPSYDCTRYLKIKDWDLDDEDEEEAY